MLKPRVQEAGFANQPVRQRRPDAAEQHHVPHQSRREANTQDTTPETDALRRQREQTSRAHDPEEKDPRVRPPDASPCTRAPKPRVPAPARSATRTSDSSAVRRRARDAARAKRTPRAKRLAPLSPCARPTRRRAALLALSHRWLLRTPSSDPRIPAAAHPPPGISTTGAPPSPHPRPARPTTRKHGPTGTGWWTDSGANRSGLSAAKRFGALRPVLIKIGVVGTE